MSKSANEVLAEALALPADARVMLAESLLESLDEPAEVVAEAWRVKESRRLRGGGNGGREPRYWEGGRGGSGCRLVKIVKVNLIRFPGLASMQLLYGLQ